MRKLILILSLMVLSFMSCMAYQIYDEQKDFLKEIISFLSAEEMNPRLISESRMEVSFKYSGKDYALKMKEQEVHPFVVSVCYYQAYDNTISRQFLTNYDSVDGIVLHLSDNTFTIKVDAMALDAESFKYAFYRILNKLKAYIDDLQSRCEDFVKSKNLDEERWFKVDVGDEKSLRSYVYELVDYQKSHVEEAKNYLHGLVRDRLDRQWAQLDTTDLAAVKKFVDGLDHTDTYLKAESERLLSRLTQENAKKTLARRWMNEAKERYLARDGNSTTDLRDIYTLLDKASSIIEFDDNTSKLYNDVKDEYFMSLFVENKTIENANTYLAEVEDGKNKKYVEIWKDKYMSDMAACLKQREKIKARTLSLDEYISMENPNGSPFIGYSKYLKKEKRKYIRSKGGSDFRFGMGASALLEEGMIRGGASADFKLGNYLRPVSCTIGMMGVYNYKPFDYTSDDVLRENYYVANLALKFNLFKLGDKCRFYVSPGIGATFPGCIVNVSGRTGLSFRVLDLSVFDFHHFESEKDFMGISLSFYL